MQVELGRLADIQIGYQVSGKDLTGSEATNLLVQTVDVSDSRGIDWARLTPCAPSRKIGDRYTLRDGDVLFLAKGPRRLAVTVRQPLPHTIAVSTFFILRVRDEAVILPEYLAWYLNAAAQEQLGAILHQTSTMAFIPKESLNKLAVDLPTTSTQVLIAAADELVRREARLAQELMDLRLQLVGALARRAITNPKE